MNALKYIAGVAAIGFMGWAMIGSAKRAIRRDQAAEKILTTNALAVANNGDRIDLGGGQNYIVQARHGVTLRLTRPNDAGQPTCVGYDAPQSWNSWTHCFENGISGFRQFRQEGESR